MTDRSPRSRRPASSASRSNAADAAGRPAPTWFVRRGEDAVVELAEVAGLARLPGGARSADRDQPGPRRADRGRARRRLQPGPRSASAAARRPTAGSGWSRRSGPGCAMRRAQRSDRAGGGRGGGHARPRRPASRAGRGAIVVACDVDNPLTGPKGAAADLRPAEGRRPRPGARSSTLRSPAGPTSSPRRPADHRGDPGAGAAGGVGFGAVALLGADAASRRRADARPARLRRGARRRGPGCHRGGSLDEQTLRGKARPPSPPPPPPPGCRPLPSQVAACSTRRGCSRAGSTASTRCSTRPPRPQQAFDRAGRAVATHRRAARG